MEDSQKTERDLRKTGKEIFLEKQGDLEDLMLDEAEAEKLVKFEEEKGEEFEMDEEEEVEEVIAKEVVVIDPPIGDVLLATTVFTGVTCFLCGDFFLLFFLLFFFYIFFFLFCFFFFFFFFLFFFFFCFHFYKPN